jgi:hypothetical protein
LLSFAGSTDTLSAVLQALARAYFNDRGLLKSCRLQDFGKLMDELRKADDQAVIYGDVLNYVDRTNEIAEGRETEKKPLAQHGRGRDRSLACSILL